MDPRHVARSRFGFSSLRPGQLEGIQALLKGKDALIVQPTGSGKSAVYQIAGAMLPGVAVIVSPLIALQKDQVDFLNGNGREEAAVLNSSLSSGDWNTNLERLANGHLKYVFVAPEQFANEETATALRDAKVGLFAVDEAHCISQWGHDFRPDYLQLGRAAESVGRPPVLAMTATASEQVRNEIVERLGMRDAQMLVGSFDRPNIYLRVDHFEEAGKKRESLLHRARWASKPGIIYVATRKAAEDLAGALEEDGITTAAYHAGLNAAARTEIQERFMNGGIDVIAATNAFGMGIDKPDVRFVYHFDAPDSLDSYYQEIGRGGRDGARAEAILFFRPQDIGAQAFHTGSGRVHRDDVLRVMEVLTAGTRGIASKELAEGAGLTARKLTSVVQDLEEIGAVTVLKSGKIKAARKNDWRQLSGQAESLSDERKEVKSLRLEDMRTYAETSGCRRELLLQYLGDTFTGPCNNCDRCEDEHPEIAVDPEVGTRREVA